MTWKRAADFLVRHVYPQGEAPQEHHPKGYGKLATVSFYYDDRTGNQVAVRSTRRRPDGWSYNVALQREYPEWVGYFHHAPSGRRVLHSSSRGAVWLARVFGLLKAYAASML